MTSEVTQANAAGAACVHGGRESVDESSDKQSNVYTHMI